MNTNMYCTLILKKICNEILKIISKNVMINNELLKKIRMKNKMKKKNSLNSFQKNCILLLWLKVVSAMEGLSWQTICTLQRNKCFKINSTYHSHTLTGYKVII